VDVETSGVDVALDRIISLAMGWKDDGEVERRHWLFDPGVPIPEQASEVHGIRDRDVEGKPTFGEKATEILREMDGCDLLGFNLINFDIPIMWEEFYRAGLEWDLSGVRVIDASVIFRKKEERTLSAAVKFYCGREHGEAHDAMGDVEATLDVFEEQCARYPDIRLMEPDEVAAYSKFDDRVDLAGKLVRDAQGRVCYAIGKAKGVPVIDDRGFGYWMLDKDFAQQTKAVLRRLLNIGRND
jgi:DNA polymerase-3 subunit epsilon